MQSEKMTVPKHAQDEYATDQEVMKALEALGPDAHRRWAQLAKNRAHKVPDITGPELLSEAIARILQGTRPWKKSVDFTAFICEVMRSVASEYLEKFKTRRKHGIRYENEQLRDDDDEARKLNDAIQQAPCSTPNPEQLLDREQQAKRERETLEELFGDDDTASIIVMAWGDGYRKAQILEEFGITPTEYESAAKKIRRRIVKFNSEGSEQ